MAMNRVESAVSTEELSTTHIIGIRLTKKPVEISTTTAVTKAGRIRKDVPIADTSCTCWKLDERNVSGDQSR